ncbi:PEG10: Retrotransposon-derived protein PEG10 [Crotalus adamanteus]|uniref:PEG10: Retrotransposon-derived protein PEG10 n=1 Tax=Crotalus adamanteus TaxID=8729 RepID=A0AAW1B1E7_CROAD
MRRPLPVLWRSRPYGGQVSCKGTHSSGRKRARPGLEGSVGRACLETGPVPPPQQTLVKHLVLPVTVFVPGQGAVEIQALVDSGATANFMDSAFAMQWSIPQQQLSPPVLVETTDRQPLRSGPVVVATRPLHMRIGPHVEEAVFYVATVSHFPVVLGLKWLRAHDLHIIWSGAVRFPSKKCATHHLHACAGNVATYPEFTRKEDKIMPRTVIPLKRLVATGESMELRGRIREVQHQDPFVAAQRHELAGDEGDKTPWMYTEDLLHF